MRIRRDAGLLAQHKATATSRRFYRWCGFWTCVGLILIYVISVSRTITEQSSDIKNIKPTSTYNICDDTPVRTRLEKHTDVLCKDPSKKIVDWDEDFLSASQIWNKRMQKFPAAVVQPRSSKEAAQILKTAFELELPITVKGGGHSPAGWSVAEEALLVDMSQMNDIEVDPEKKILTAEGGARWIDVLPLIEKHNLAFVGGECPQVGVVGVFLGGGTGWLSRGKGLISDNVLSLELALPNGTLTEVSRNHHSELLWALSGAGHSNFGIVTKVHYQLYDAQPKYFAGDYCIWGLKKEEAKKFGKLYAEIIPKIESEEALTIYFVFRSEQSKSVCFTLFYDGPIENGPEASRQFLDGISELVNEDTACRVKRGLCKGGAEKATPEQVNITKKWVEEGRMYIDEGHNFTSFSKLYGGGDPLHALWRSGVVPFVNSTIMDALIDSVSDGIAIPGLQKQFQINHNRGAIARMSDQYSCFPYRNATHVIAIHGVFVMRQPSSVDAQAMTWMEKAYSAMKPYTIGAYSNYNDPDLSDWEHAYYGGNYERLKALKDELQGGRVFRTAQRI